MITLKAHDIVKRALFPATVLLVSAFSGCRDPLTAPPVSRSAPKAASVASVTPGPTFQNPVFTGGDPWVVYDNGTYYYTRSYGCPATICVKTSQTLTGLASAPWVGVWNKPATGPNSGDVWAPELHKINGTWYIYYAADIGGDNNSHRLFVLQANSTDPLGSYSMGNTGAANGQLVESTGHWAIDPNVFTAANGSLYIVWSCTNYTNSTGPQATCISRMSDALHVTGATVQISTPNQAWEKRTAPIQEGPVGFVRNGRTYITYSGSASWIDNDYSVGLLTNTDGNILTAASWSKQGPIFDHHGTAYGTGSVVFVQSPDGLETWNVYHGIDNLTCTPAYSCRDIRMQKVYWASDGTPILGYPENPSVPLNVPSGEQGYVGTGSALPDWDAAFGDAAEGNSTAGNIVGSWSPTDRETNTSNSLGAGWMQTFSAWNPNREDYTVNVDVQWLQTGTTAAYPKYGIYAAYSDVNNYVSVWFDRNTKVVGSFGVVNGTAQAWGNCSLPSGFNPAVYNNLQVQKVGTTFNIILNGTRMSGACTGRTFNILNGQLGLVTSDTRASFKNLHRL